MGAAAEEQTMTPTFRPFAPADVEELVSMMRELFERDGATFNERQLELS